MSKPFVPYIEGLNRLNMFSGVTGHQWDKKLKINTLLGDSSPRSSCCSHALSHHHLPTTLAFKYPLTRIHHTTYSHKFKKAKHEAISTLGVSALFKSCCGYSKRRPSQQYHPPLRQWPPAPTPLAPALSPPRLLPPGHPPVDRHENRLRRRRVWGVYSHPGKL